MKIALIAPEEHARENRDDEPARDADREALHGEAREERGEVHDGADRKVDAAGEEDEGDPDRGDADERGLLDDVAEVFCRKELRFLRACPKRS